MEPVDSIDRYEQFIPKPLPPPHGRLGVQILLLVLTLFTTTLTGGCHYDSFVIDMSTIVPGTIDPGMSDWQIVGAAFRELGNRMLDPFFWVHGLWYSLTILLILGCHEMGHYVMCLRYNVDATRPYFLPAPLPLTGTLGAFIRLRSRIPSKIALFDIGVAGPIAGFVIAVPALFLGLWLSRLDRLPEDMSNFSELGEPLLFQFAAWAIWGPVADGYSLNLHPMAFAAWFGLLATALNLFPIGQLDGGHISYAVLGRGSTFVTLATVAGLIGLTFVSTSWLVWTVLTVVMLVVFGPRHPRTIDEDIPLDPSRIWLAVVALAIFVLCFTHNPIEPIELLGR